MSNPSPPRPRSFDCPEQEVFLELWRTYDRLRAVEDELFARHDLTAQQYNALRLLKAHPKGMPTLTLASRLISRSPDITRLVDRLEERGLVRRDRRADNRRVVLVFVTAAGLALLEQLSGPVLDCARQQLGHLDERQQRQLIALLRAARTPHEGPGSEW
jgi:DNA-binding MarR family transcriptional regulator